MKDRDAIIEELTRQVAILMERITMLEKDNQLLREEIARLKKNSDDSSKPPSSDQNKPVRVAVRSKVNRKQGGQPGHKKHSRQPFTAEEIDKVVKHELKGKDAAGLEPLDDWYVIQQVTLPQKLYFVTEHRARKYRNPLTNEIIIAPLPNEVTKGGLLGANITAMMAFLKGECHTSFTTIQSFFQEVIGLKISRGLIAKKVAKVSAALGPAYDELLARLPQEKVIGIDETGHKNKGKKHWIWCLQTPLYSLFHIDQSRGSKVLFDILGKDFDGLINCDFFGAYRKYFRLTEATIQFCMAHLIREVKFLTKLTCETLKKWAENLLGLIKEMFKARHNAEKFTPTGLRQKLERIKARFLDKVRQPPGKPAQNISRRFRGDEMENYFRFITNPDIEPTNNGTEREIRHTVIDRRITYGTRGNVGIRWCQRIWTTIATCKKQKQNVFDFIHKSIIAHWNGLDYPKLL